MNIVHFVSDRFNEYNSSHFRVTIPATALNNAGHSVNVLSISDWLKQTPIAISKCATADVIVIQRVMVQDSISNAKKWIQHGKKVILDFDDAYDLIGKENSAYPFWGEGIVEIVLEHGTKYKKKMIPHPIEQLKTGMATLSGATVPSMQLVKDWSKYTPMYYLPNLLDSSVYNVPLSKNKKITIGWGGSMSHLTSWAGSGVEKALANIINKRNDVELLIVGDKRVVDQISAKIDRSKIKFLPYVMFTDWPKVLAKFDIGIAPLAGEYDCRRSRLKVMEYLAMGIPFIATKAMPYFELLDTHLEEYFVDQGDLDKADKPNMFSWELKIESIIDNIVKEREKAQSNKAYFYDWYDVNKNIDNIVDVYERIKNE